MRPLVLSPEITARIAAQVEWANRPENRYRAGVDPEPPGDNPAYVMLLEHGFRVVYSRTLAPDGSEWRHLSISVEGTKYPNQFAVYTIATLFGFTGGNQELDTTVKPGPSWRMDVDQRARCIIVAQRMESEVAKP